MFSSVLYAEKRLRQHFGMSMLPPATVIGAVEPIMK